jgi:hypothetical protein
VDPCHIARAGIRPVLVDLITTYTIPMGGYFRLSVPYPSRWLDPDRRNLHQVSCFKIEDKVWKTNILHRPLKNQQKNNSCFEDLCLYVIVTNQPIGVLMYVPHKD